MIKAGPEWRVLAVNDLGDGRKATPAIAGRKPCIRRYSTVYYFSRKDRACGAATARRDGVARDAATARPAPAAA